VLALNERREEMKASSYILVELLEEENSRVLGDVQAVVTSQLAANTLCSLALTPGAGDSLQMSLSHQLTFVTRVLELPVDAARDPLALGIALRERRMALMHRFPPSGSTQRVLACEAVAPHSPGRLSAKARDRFA
jgi:hypothetical protein